MPRVPLFGADFLGSGEFLIEVGGFLEGFFFRVGSVKLVLFFFGSGFGFFLFVEGRFDDVDVGVDVVIDGELVDLLGILLVHHLLLLANGLPLFCLLLLLLLVELLIQLLRLLEQLQDLPLFQILLELRLDFSTHLLFRLLRNLQLVFWDKHVVSLGVLFIEPFCIDLLSGPLQLVLP